MLSKVWSAAVRGVEGFMVGVEIDLSNGLPSFTTVGLPDSSVREARDRVVSAVRNSGFEFPSRRTTVNLSPAEVRKAGTQFDLPIGLGVLMASGQLDGGDWARGCCFLGELALDGSVRPVSGVLPMALSARERGGSLVLPRGNAREALAVGVQAYGVCSLREAVDLIKEGPTGLPPGGGREGLTDGGEAGAADTVSIVVEDLSEVRGQALARRALEIAAAGGHNLLMVGPPGVGKSMLARRVVGILPPLTQEEALEISRIYSVCGLLAPGSGLVSRRPFRAPHHTISPAALTGGGARCRPGEISLAHRGVLFLDELAEFPRSCLEVLRQPVEDRSITVSRLKETAQYPADFMLIGAMNPCPCGFLGHPERACRCSEHEIHRYRARISGPLLDRIDLMVELPPLPFFEWAAPQGRTSEGSAEVRQRVVAARAFAAGRGVANARLAGLKLKDCAGLDSAGLKLAESAARRFCLSPRGLDRLLRVARTIADLSGFERIREAHLAEALQYRLNFAPAGVCDA